MGLGAYRFGGRGGGRIGLPPRHLRRPSFRSFTPPTQNMILKSFISTWNVELFMTFIINSILIINICGFMNVDFNATATRVHNNDQARIII